MLISIWWVLVALVVGSSAGVLALALLSAKSDEDENDVLTYDIPNPTR